jgi:hypothetical protein
MGTKLIKRVLADESHEYFELTDDKGREIGFETRVWACTYAEAPDGYRCYLPGVQYEVDTHATRDGKPFGAQTRSEIAETLERALAIARTKAATSRKRYAKLFPG